MEEGATSEGRRGMAQCWNCTSAFCAVLLPFIYNSLLMTLLLPRAASPSATRNPTFLVWRLILQLKTLAIKKCLRAINECYTPSEPQGNRRWHMTSDVKEIAGKSYDYIIIGGGTCGCPLAATLSEEFSMLLIERGGFCYGW